jgi:hypothetical protein
VRAPHGRVAIGSQTGYIPAMRVALVAVATLFAVLVGSAGCSCGAPTLPKPPVQCSVSTGVGCLPDEVCVDGTCQPVGRCESDVDCPSIAYRCVFPAQFCALRPGFGEECSQTAPCDAGSFCALGTCREAAASQPCATRLDCAPGFMCDKQSFFCIEEAPCTFADQGFPETTCDFEEVCDDGGACRQECQGLCTPETEEQDCGAGLRCDGACRCVQCLDASDCGAGLVCNVRSGRCQSENLCFSNADCASPLECDPRTALCILPPPPCDDDFDCAVAEICNLQTTRCELPGGACFDDRFEDADTPASAEAFSLTVGVPRLFDDLVLCPDDDDVYLLELLAGDRVTATVTGALPQARATLWLLDSNAETSVAFAETPPRGNGRLIYTAQRDESVYLRVNALLAQTSYDLEVAVESSTPCAADFFEGELGNDTLATATPPALVPFGVALQGEVCPQDTELFAVDVGPGEGVSASLSFDAARADLDLAILDADGAVIGSSAGITQPEAVGRRLVNGGRLYVRVRGFGNSVGAWRLTVARLGAITCTDALEPDDAAPRIISVGNIDDDIDDAVVFENRGLCQGGALADADRWAVSVLDFERLVASATTNELRLVLQIEDDDGAVLARSPIGVGGATVSADATVGVGLTETMFVRAFSEQAQVGPYAIRLFKENQGSCAPDDAEPNDAITTRSALPSPDTLLTICESDEDFFVLTGVAGKRATIDATFSHGDADLDVQLLGLDGRQILATADSASDNEHLEVILPLDGEYTVRVFSLTSGAKARYTLSAVVESPP